MIIFFNLSLAEETRILYIGIDMNRSHQITFYTSHEPKDKKQSVLSVNLFKLDILDSVPKLEFVQDYCLDETHLGDPIVDFKFTLVNSGNDSVAYIITESGYWRLMCSNFNQIATQGSMIEYFKGTTLKQIVASKIQVGLECIYFTFKTGQTLVLELDASHDKPSIKFIAKLDFRKEDSITNMLTERFLRLHGRYLLNDIILYS